MDGWMDGRTDGRAGVRAHEKKLVKYTWIRFIVNENHNGINLICIFKGNYKR